MDRGAWWAIVQGVTKSLTGLSLCVHAHTHTHTHTHTHIHTHTHTHTHSGEKEYSDQEGGVRQAGRLRQG